MGAPARGADHLRRAPAPQRQQIRRRPELHLLAGPGPPRRAPGRRRRGHREPGTRDPTGRPARPPHAERNPSASHPPGPHRFRPRWSARRLAPGTTTGAGRVGNPVRQRIPATAAVLDARLRGPRRGLGVRGDGRGGRRDGPAAHRDRPTGGDQRPGGGPVSHRAVVHPAGRLRRGGARAAHRRAPQRRRGVLGPAGQGRMGPHGYRQPAPVGRLRRPAGQPRLADPAGMAGSRLPLAPARCDPPGGRGPPDRPDPPGTLRPGPEPGGDHRHAPHPGRVRGPPSDPGPERLRAPRHPGRPRGPGRPGPLPLQRHPGRRAP